MDLHPENVNVKSLMEYASNNYVDILKENKNRLQGRDS